MKTMGKIKTAGLVSIGVLFFTQIIWANTSQLTTVNWLKEAAILSPLEPHCFQKADDIKLAANGDSKVVSVVKPTDSKCEQKVAYTLKHPEKKKLVFYLCQVKGHVFVGDNYQNCISKKSTYQNVAADKDDINLQVTTQAENPLSVEVGILGKEE